jgi:glycosyltransferase involved in cell wall biosynthesis
MAMRYFAWVAVQYVRWKKPDIVYTRNIWAALWLTRLGYPVVFEGHQLPGTYETPAFACLLQCAASTSAFRGFVLISQGVANAYRSMGAPMDKVLVLHDGVDMERFQSPERHRIMSFVDTIRVVCYVGSMGHGRGVDVLLEAVDKLHNVVLLLVGGQPDDIAFYRALVQQKGYSRVVIVGHVPNTMVPHYLFSADVVVIPSTSDLSIAAFTSPMKLFEYMAAERPIVATALPTIHEVLQHEQNALLVDPDSAEALARGIRRVLDEPMLAQQIAQKARSDINYYTWNRRAAVILDTFVS